MKFNDNDEEEVDPIRNTNEEVDLDEDDDKDVGEKDAFDVIEKVMDKGEEFIRVSAITTVLIFLVPIIVLICTFAAVGNGIVSLSGAVTIIRWTLSIFAIFGIGLWRYNRKNKKKKHRTRDNVMFAMSIFSIIILVFTTFFLPIKMNNYGTKDYVKFGKDEIPTVYKFEKNKKFFFSFKGKEDTSVVYNKEKVDIHYDYICILYLKEDWLTDDKFDNYGEELKKLGYVKYIPSKQYADAEEEIRMYYKYYEQGDYILYCSIEECSIMYGKITCKQKLPEGSNFIQYMENKW